jgi:MarR family transcriptional regulator, negative regulator of the multidrug operon emrRAB
MCLRGGYIGGMTEQHLTAPEAQAKDLDYWSFVELARERLNEEFDDNDARATRAVLSLSRAASLVIYDLESSIHRPRGWSWSAFRLMFVLWLAGPMESAAAANLTGMSRAAVSNLSNTLVASGLLLKEAATQDRRAVTLSMTDKGLSEIREAFRDHNRQESRWASVLTEIEQDLLVMLLEKLMSGREEVGARFRK